MTSDRRLNLVDFLDFYRALGHQRAAFQILEEEILRVSPELLSDNAEWYKVWTAGGRFEDTSKALALIKKWEGFRNEAYVCPAGYVTIGYGSRRYEDGSWVRMGEKITVSRGEQLLQLEVDRLTSMLEQRIPFWVEMGNNQRCALISFAYNVGENFYGHRHFQTISGKLALKSWESVPDALFLYHNPGTDFSEGLIARRIEEGELWAMDI